MTKRRWVAGILAALMIIQCSPPIKDEDAPIKRQDCPYTSPPKEPLHRQCGDDK